LHAHEDTHSFPTRRSSDLDAKGAPTTREGEEAKHSMESRRNAAMRERDELIKQIVANAKVYQGGGSELLNPTLEERVREATNARSEEHTSELQSRETLVCR